MQSPLRLRRRVIGLVAVACMGCQTQNPLLKPGHLKDSGADEARVVDCRQLEHDADYLRAEIKRWNALLPYLWWSVAQPGSFVVPGPGCSGENCLLSLALMPVSVIAGAVLKADNLDKYEQTLASREKAMRELECPGSPRSTDAAFGVAAPAAVFDGPARWHPDPSMLGFGVEPPARGVAGRLVVLADGGVVFFERVGSAGAEVPYNVPREAVVHVQCAVPTFAIRRVGGATERFAALNDASGADDETTTLRACRLVRDPGVSASGRH